MGGWHFLRFSSECAVGSGSLVSGVASVHSEVAHFVKRLSFASCIRCIPLRGWLLLHMRPFAHTSLARKEPNSFVRRSLASAPIDSVAPPPDWRNHVSSASIAVDSVTDARILMRKVEPQPVCEFAQGKSPRKKMARVLLIYVENTCSLSLHLSFSHGASRNYIRPVFPQFLTRLSYDASTYPTRPGNQLVSVLLPRAL